MAVIWAGCGGGSGETAGVGSTQPPPASSVTLTVHVSGGSVQGTGWSCATDCQRTFSGQASETLQAVPAPGAAFIGWQGDCAGSGTCTVSLDRDRTVTAGFGDTRPVEVPLHTVTVASFDASQGRVTSVPAGIDCPGRCTLAAAEGTLVTLSAAPAEGFDFGGWTGDCRGAGDCAFVLQKDTALAASFVPTPLPEVCANLLPDPLPAAARVFSPDPGSCMPGIADGAGTLLLGASTGQGASARLYDASGALAGAIDASAAGPLSVQFFPQPLGFVEVQRMPEPEGSPDGPPSQAFVIQGFDPRGNPIPANNSGLRGRFSIGSGPAGGLFLAGDLVSTDSTGATTEQHQLCPVAQSGQLEICQRREAQGAVFGTAVDLSGNALIITAGASRGTITAQWFDRQGMALTSEFILIARFTAGQNTWFEGRPLLGGGLAVRRVDQEDDSSGHPLRTAQWLLTVDAGSSVVHAVPAWLAARPDTDLAAVRGGRAYAVLPMGKESAACEQKVELLAPDGTRCGDVTLPAGPGSCRTEDVGVGLDGTLLEIVPRDLAPANACGWSFWPAALR